MRVVMQRVTQASVKFENQENKIGKGLVIFLAVTSSDRSEDIDYLSRKIINLRIFSDVKGLMNKSILDEKGEILLIPQFTLYARTRKGNRPSFVDAAEPIMAQEMFDAFSDRLKMLGLPVKIGKFGSLMQISLTNDGPVTIIIDSSERKITRKRMLN